MLHELRVRLFAIAAGVLFALLLIEICARAFFTRLPPIWQSMISGVRLYGVTGLSLDQVYGSPNSFYDICVGDPVYGVRMLPNIHDFRLSAGPDNVYHVTTNSLGFDDIGFRTTTSDGDWWGVVVGDSMSWCMGVEYETCWVRHMESELGQPIANLGIVGASSTTSLRILRDFGVSLEPDLVIWQYYANDPFEDYHFARGKLGGPRRGSTRHPGATESLRDWLSHTFVTYGLLVAPVGRALFPSLAGRKQAVITETMNGVVLSAPIRPRSPSHPQVRDGLEIVKHNLLEAKTLSRGKGFRLLVVFVPTNLQVYRDYLRDISLVDQADDENEQYDELVAFLSANDIDYIDLRAGFVSQASLGRVLYFHRDCHLNATGNEVVAKLILEHIAQDQ